MGDINAGQIYTVLKHHFVNIDKIENESIKTNIVIEKETHTKYYFFKKTIEKEVLEFHVNEPMYIASLITGEIESVEITASKYQHLFDEVRIKYYNGGTIIK